MSPKGCVVTAVALTMILFVYTSDVGQPGGNHSQEEDSRDTLEVNGSDDRRPEKMYQGGLSSPHPEDSTLKRELEVCPKLEAAEADINTVEVFKDFEFQPAWLASLTFWNKTFEDRYKRQKKDPETPPLKVFIVPHSHNDAGWLKTFEQYFRLSSRQIMNNMVAKLLQYKNLTFIWSEISFLNAWWEEAHPSKKKALRELVQSGRLEITTGGWVMTDEANVHLYAMIDQLIEGHQWVWTNLGIKPISGWAVDPFGHGSTVPYLLAASGLKGTIIQRIHYAWKQWLALKQYGDFRWIPTWSPSDPAVSILTHNQPFDIYSIEHSCGPHSHICRNFNFNQVQGEYTYYSTAQAITRKNVKQKSELLLEQFAKTGSLFPHNTVLMPLGGDFSYELKKEWDQQYTNYIKLINYINVHKDQYKAEVAFGTPAMFFQEITKRYSQYPTLKGDFFVYSEIFTSGKPDYWSGYFTTRPFMKLLDRELENSLRSAEILYTVALNNAKQNKLTSYLKILKRDFKKLVTSRRNLGLFQHHDGITGTSKSFVMRDYGLKLFEGIQNTINIQQNALESLVFPNISIKPNQTLILSDIERKSYEKLPRKTSIEVGPIGANQTRKVLVYNSLAKPQEHLVQLRVNTSNVKVTDSEGNDIIYQVNPVWDMTDNTKLWIAADEYEVTFIAKLPELSVISFNLVYTTSNSEKLATIYCKKCQKKSKILYSENDIVLDVLQADFTIKNIPPGDIQLESNKIKIVFNGYTGLMKTITRKRNPKIMKCGIQFAAYRNTQFKSGAYLFRLDRNKRDYEKDVLQQYKYQKTIMITTGPISTKLTVIYGAFLMHTVTIYLVENSTLADAISIENTVDFEESPKNSDMEFFMRIISDIQNGEPPEFYSDLNGFNMQRRVKVERIGLEGNYFPITSMAYIEDNNLRLSLLTNHAQGASSWQPGFLEVMLDRRALHSDNRGMNEGIEDNRRSVSKYWLVIEDVSQIKSENSVQQKRYENSDNTFKENDIVQSLNVPTKPIKQPKQESFSRPSLYASHMSNLLNYPAGIFILDTEHQLSANKSFKLINHALPCDVHLLTLRTQPDAVYSQFPSSSALMVLHRQGYDCSFSGNYTCDAPTFDKNFNFEFVTVKDVELKSLTGLETLSTLQSLGEVYIEPMSLKTLNVTFV